MTSFKTGDGVTIKTREVTPDDSKTGLYYQYFGGLIGTVDRVYDDGSICVDVDIETLSDEARKRHLAMQEAERRRWLESLSGEARSRLNEEQRRLKISYKLLVSKKDLESRKGDTSTAGTTGKSGASDKAPKSSEDPSDAPAPVKRAAKPSDEEPVKRLTEADLEAREQEFLRSLQERP